MENKKYNYVLDKVSPQIAKLQRTQKCFAAAEAIVFLGMLAAIYLLF